MTTRLFLALSLALSLSACAEEKDDSGSPEEADCSGEGLDGTSLYATNCSGCHGADGSGATGPSLVDAMPLSDDASVLETINDGAGNMPPFEGTLSCDEQHAVLDYLRDQHGDQGGA